METLIQPIVATADSGAAGMCSAVPGSQQCIDATPCKTFADGQLVCLAGAAAPDGATAVSQTCWSYSYQYSCEIPGASSTCAPYETNAECTVVKSACADQNSETGACNAWNYSYQCLTAPAVTESKLACSSTSFDSSAMTAPANKNANFTKAVLAMEIAREHKQHYCSFNSVLAKIINTQGKAQMSRDVSNCSGLSPEQVTQLDFTRIDFSEFTGKLLSEAQAGLPNNVQGNYTPVMQKTRQGVLQSPDNGLAYPPSTAPGEAPPTSP